MFYDLNDLSDVDWEMFYDGCGFADQKFIDFVKASDKAQLSMMTGQEVIDNYGVYLNNAGKQVSKFSGALKSLAANIGITLGVMLAIKGAIALWDYVSVTVAEQTEKVEALTAAYKELESEHEQLSNKQDLTDGEKRRLEYLEERLALDKQILELEKQRQFNELTGNKFTDYFDPDNLNAKYLKERDANTDGSLRDLELDFDNKKKELEEITEELDQEIERRESSSEGSILRGIIDREISRLTTEKEAIESEFTDIELGFSNNLAKYMDDIDMLQGMIDSGELTDTQVKIAEQWIDDIYVYYNETKAMLDEIQKMTGTYVPTLNEQVNYRNQGIGDVGNTRDQSDFAKVQTYTRNLTDEQKQLWLEVTKGIVGADNAIKAYEKSIKAIEDKPESSPIPNITASVQQMAKQLQPQFAQLGEAYQQIFTADGFTLDNVNNEMLESLRTSFNEIEEEIGVAFDPSATEKFFDVISNGKSTSSQVQQAFNDLATAYFYSTDTLKNLNAETALAIEKQLEEMGVTNAHEVVVDGLAQKELELAAAKKFAANSGKDLETATASEILAFTTLRKNVESCSQEMLLYYLNKALCADGTIETKQDCIRIYNLAKAANVGTHELTLLSKAIRLVRELDEAINSGDMHTAHIIETQLAAIEAQVANGINVDVETEVEWPDAKGAGSAGKEAADEYLESFEKELSDLDQLKDSGLISEKQYLDRLRALYNKYFRDKKKYVQQYAKYERQYLEGMKGLYESVFSYMTSKIQDRIDAVNDERDARIDALEAERDAAQANIDAQKEALDNQIKSIEKQIKQKDKIIDGINKEIDGVNDEIDGVNDVIDAINDEIEAMRDANQERKDSIDLQKKQYDLQRLMNQRTSLVYKGGQMQYVADESSIRDKREELADAKLNQEIAAKEKEIELQEAQIEQKEKEIELLETKIEKVEEEITILEERRDAIEEQQDLLDEQADAINKYYDAQIEATERFYDAMIASMERQKSKFEEMQEMFEEAQMKALLEEFGINEEALLAGSEEEFNKLRDAYLGLLKDMSAGNQGILDALTQLSGVDMSSFAGYLDQTKGAFDGLGSTLTTVSAELTPVTAEMDKLAAESTDAATGVDNLKLASDGVTDNLAGIADATTSINTENILTAAENFKSLAEAIEAVATALRISEDGATSSIATTIGAINDITFGGEGADGAEGEGIIGQFTKLKTAIGETESALTGKSAGGEESGGEQTSGVKEGESSGAGLHGAISETKKVSDDNLPTVSDHFAANGQSTNISGNSIKTSVGMAGDSMVGGDTMSEEDSLAGKIKELTEKTQDGKIGVPAQIEQWTALGEMLSTIQSTVEGIYNSMVKLASVKFDNLPSATTGVNAFIPALLSEGTNGTLKRPVENAIVAENNKPEIITRNDGTYEMVTSPTMTSLDVGDGVIGEDDTDKLLNGRNIKASGKTFASGTFDFSKFDFTPLEIADPIAFKEFNRTSEALAGAINTNTLMVNKMNDTFEGIIREITNSQNITNQRNQDITMTVHATFPNITNSSKVEDLLRDLDSIKLKAMQKFT